MIILGHQLHHNFLHSNEQRIQGPVRERIHSQISTFNNLIGDGVIYQDGKDTGTIITPILLSRVIINYGPHALVKIYLVIQLILLCVTMKQGTSKILQIQAMNSV